MRGRYGTRSSSISSGARSSRPAAPAPCGHGIPQHVACLLEQPDPVETIGTGLG